MKKEQSNPPTPEYQGPLIVNKLTDEIYTTIVRLGEESGYKIDNHHFLSQVLTAFKNIEGQFVADFLEQVRKNHQDNQS
jgi:hypothetical protein